MHIKSWVVKKTSNWRTSVGEGWENLHGNFVLIRPRNNLQVQYFASRLSDCWAAVVEHQVNTLSPHEVKPLLKNFVGAEYRTPPTVIQALGYLLRNNIPHAVIDHDSNCVAFFAGGDKKPGVAIVSRGGRLGQVIAYQAMRSRVLRGASPYFVVPDALDVPEEDPCPFGEMDLEPEDVYVHTPARYENMAQVEQRLLEHHRKGALVRASAERTDRNVLYGFFKYPLAHEKFMLQQLDDYALTLGLEKSAFDDCLRLFAREQAVRAELVAEAEVWPEPPSEFIPDFTLAIGRAAPPVGTGGLAQCRRWYGYTSTEECPGVVRSTSRELELLDLCRFEVGVSSLDAVDRDVHVLRELTEESVLGETLRDGDYFYARHVPALSIEQLCSGVKNPQTVSGLRLEMPFAEHEVIARLVPVGLPFKVRQSVYTVYRWTLSANTKWQSAVSIVLNPTVKGFLYDKPALGWPALRDVVGPSLDYRYRVLYSLLALHMPTKCGGLLQLARSAEMGLEERSGVEPAVVAASICSLEERLEAILPGPPLEVH